MITVHLKPMMYEAAASRGGRPGYRWAQGYLVTNPVTGNSIYPPVSRAEAYDLARQLGGADAKIVIDKEIS